MSGSRRARPLPEGIIFNDYEVRDELGRGGAGVVYLAWQVSLQRLVALKVILDDHHADDEERQRFAREAKATARLQHDGIVQIYEVGEKDGRSFMALELIEGGSLHDFLDRTPRPYRWSAEVVLRLAQIMAYCHEHGIVHRDLKPANVLLPGYRQPDPASPPTSGDPHTDDAGQALPAPAAFKVTDFGLARELFGESGLTRIGAPMGTPAYMAPEQAAGDVANAGPAADIYALGAILYRLVTGRPPFASKDPYQTFRMVIHDDPPAPRQLQPGLPRDLESICLKCLAKDPQARYESAAELAEDLALLLADEPIRTAQPDLARRAYRWARHKPLLMLAMVLGAGFYALHMYARQVLESPGHTGNNHWVYSATVGAALGGAAIAQRALESRRWRRVGERMYALIGVLAVTVTAVIDKGPASAPIPIYLVIIAYSALIAPRPTMVWLVSVACAGAYTLVVAHATWWTGQVVDTEAAIAFGLCLLGMSLTIHFLLRVARR